MIPINLSNKVAVITGGSSALGRVMVRTLAKAGANIAICYHRNEEIARRLQGEIVLFDGKHAFGMRRTLPSLLYQIYTAEEGRTPIPLGQSSIGRQKKAPTRTKLSLFGADEVCIRFLESVPGIGKP